MFRYESQFEELLRLHDEMMGTRLSLGLPLVTRVDSQPLVTETPATPTDSGVKPDEGIVTRLRRLIRVR